METIISELTLEDRMSFINNAYKVDEGNKPCSYIGVIAISLLTGILIGFAISEITNRERKKLLLIDNHY